MSVADLSKGLDVFGIDFFALKLDVLISVRVLMVLNCGLVFLKWF